MMSCKRPDPVWSVSVFVEGEIVVFRDVTGTEGHARAVGVELCTAQRALSDREGPWDVDVTLAIRGRADVYWNGSAPPGWVEIQREDTAERPTDFGDMEAAQAVCDAAGIPRSCAMLWRSSVGGMFSSDGAEPDADCIVVPAIVAWLAHLIDEEQLKDANQHGS